MANQYTLTNDFAAIAEEKGTIYNKGDSAIELASTADTEKGAGILLLTGERRTFSGTLYARSMDAAGLLNVADFKDGGEGGEDNLSGVPLGTILPYSGTGDTPPYGFLFFEGQAVSRTMYAAYFDLVGTTYGEGDGKNTFNLPNLIDAAMLHGSYTKTSYETAGSATFTAPKTGFYKITVKGGGGGGDGGAYGAAVASGYLGGGEGGTTIAYEKMTAGQTASVVIGAGGAGGTGNPNSLNNRSGYPGGNSTVTVNGITYSGGGGISSVGGTGTIPGASGSNGYATTITSISATGGSGGGSGGGVHDQNGILGGGGGAGSAQIGSYANNGGKGGDGYVWIEYIGVSMRYIGKVYDAPTPSSAQVDLSQYLSDLARRLTREQTPAFNKRDVITTSGTYTAPVTGWYRITVKGGGGGGAASYAVASQYARTGGGGGEGGKTIGWEHLDAGDTATVVIGAGGNGGTVTTGNIGSGSSGGNTSVAVNNNTYTGNGGKGATAHGGIGGSGTVAGASGTSGSISSVSGVFVLAGVGGGNGGASTSNTVPAANSGGGGSGGNSMFAGSTLTQYAGNAGAAGFASFEYFDPSLN